MIIRRTVLGLVAAASLMSIPACVNLAPQADNTRWFMLDQFAVTTAYEGDFDDARQLHVSRPHIPEYLNSQNIFYRTVDGTPRTTQQERWAEPFNEGFARTLALRLSARTGVGNVSYYPIPRPSDPGARVQIQIFQFEAIEGIGVVLDMNWRIQGSDATAEYQRFRRSHAVSHFDSVDAMVRAMSELLDEVVAAIAEAVSAAEAQN